MRTFANAAGPVNALPGVPLAGRARRPAPVPKGYAAVSARRSELHPAVSLPAATLPPRGPMIALSLAQGLALLFLWRALDNGTWPSRTPALEFPLWTFAIAWPGLLLLSLEAEHKARTIRLVSLFTALLVLLAIYMGGQASPAGEIRIAWPHGSFLAIYVATMLVACFLALLHVPQWAGRRAAGYEALFALSWRNFLITGLALMLTGGVYVLLHLWGRLFSAIGVPFFEGLFARDWFLFPVLAVAFGAGVQIFRRLVHLIDGITGLLEGLMRLLLPLAVAVVALFLASLPFTGLGPLWETGSGTALLMWLNAFVLFFLNAVYQTGHRAPCPPLVHRALGPGIALLPALSVLALYGLSLRVGQYGWSVERCWGFSVCVFLALLSTGYAWCVVRRRDDWPRRLGEVNKVAGWGVLAFVLLVNSPLLDFRSISLASQVRRVETGEIAWRDFDFRYARDHLARPGWLQMQVLIDAFESSDPELALRIREAARPAARVRARAIWERVVYRPEPFEAPAGVREIIDRFFLEPRSGAWMPRGPEVHVVLPGPDGPIGDVGLVRVDLNGGGEPEYVLIVAWTDPDRVFGLCIYRDGGGWSSLPMAMREPLPEGADLARILRGGALEAVPPAFRDLRVGGLVLGRM